MSKTFDPLLTARKFLVSGFVVFSFAAYAIHERNSNEDGAPQGAVLPTTGASSSSQNSTLQQAATTLPSAAVLPNGQYRDGIYMGNVENAFWGNVQVQVTIQGGRIAGVQFLDYPHDRRTSQRINAYAMPYLTQEAVQVQNAKVDIVSGATLTSEAFAQSLQTALDNARG
jgi:uncharacterized protein with FMN-binding domain